MLERFKHWFFKQPQITLSLSFCEKGVTLVGLSAEKVVTHCVFFPKVDMQNALTEYVAENRLQKKSCLCILAFDDYQTFLLEKPKVPKTELLEAIGWRVADFIDYPMDALKMDYIELPHKQSQEMIYIIAANQSHITQITSLVQCVGLIPVMLDIPELTLGTIFNHKHDNRRAQAFLSFQKNWIHLHIYKGNQLLLMRRIEMTQSQYESDQEGFCHELALQIQRSVDYCSSTLTDASNAIIFVERGEEHSFLMEKIEQILGLTVQPFVFDAFKNPSQMNYQTLAAMGGLLRGFNE